MSQTPLNPEELGDELDRLLTPGEGNLSPLSSDPLVAAAALLNSAPRSSLSPEAHARIWAKVLAAQALAPAPSTHHVPVQRRFRPPTPLRLALVASVMILLIATTLIVARNSTQQLNAPPTTSSTVTQTFTPSHSLALTSTAPAIVPSATPLQPTATATVVEAPTATPATPTVRPTTAVPTSTTILPALSLSPTPNLIAPTVTPDLTLLVTIVLEGPIQAIEGNALVIFDLTVL